MINELRNNKITKLGRVFDETQIDNIWKYLAKKQQYGGHVKRSANGESANSSCYSLEDIILTPYLLELGLKYSSLAQEYLEQKSYLYSMNIFTTYPAEHSQHDIQEFHSDYDDSKFVALFVYLTDVMDETDGAHQLRYENVTATILGHAGTAFMADTRYSHRGIKPTKLSRTIAWIRWGVSDPPRTNIQDGIYPINKNLLGNRYSEDNKELLHLIIV